MSFLRFQERPSATGKTRVWTVQSAQGGDSLGEVKWYGPWRRYCFFPADCLFDAGCLREIADLCATKTTEHKR